MLEIIPAINAEDWETVNSRIEAISSYADWVHLDVADGKFTKNVTWNNPDDLKTINVKYVRIEAHLMILEPEKHLEQWAKSGIRRAILHWETLKPKGIFGGSPRKKLEQISQILKDNWVELGLSVLYKTNVREIEPYLDLVDLAQLLAVEPGLAGQEFRPEVVAKLRELRQMVNAVNPQIKIEIDGGVNVSNVKELYIAGANVVAAASAIFGAAEPNLALETLKRAVLG